MSLNETYNWFTKALPNPEDKNRHAQLGCHLEEVAEMLDAVSPLNDQTRDLVDRAHIALSLLAYHLKGNTGVISVTENQRGDFLDALCDQLVTATGTAYVFGLNPVGGLKEVNRSNWSKFDENGQPIFGTNNKIIKGPNYSPPDLAPFIN